MRRILCLLLIVLALPAFPAGAKKAKPGTDEFAIESTVLAVYNVLSGPAGRRDWNRFKELFVDGARITKVRDGVATMTTPDDYATAMKPIFEQNALFERPVETRIDRFRGIAHVTSRYESRHATTDAAPYERGVLHVELVQRGDRWQVLSIVRHAE